MPRYAYVCTNCGYHFDAQQSFAEDALTVCPKCEGRLRKRYDSIGVTFHGGGFYRTDSRAPAAKEGSSQATPTTTATKSDSASPAAPSTT